MLKVVITGPESTGKSTLALALAEHFNTPLVQEYAREYLEKKYAKTVRKDSSGEEGLSTYDATDLFKMLTIQIKNEEKSYEALLLTNKKGILICDTDSLTFKIWSEEVFNNIEPKTQQLIDSQFINSNKNDEAIYLLCSPEGIIWQADPLRENPNDRDRLFEIYKSELIKHKKNYFILRGSKKERFSAAINIIESFLSKSDRVI